MLVLKDILGGSLKITSENSNNLWGKKKASKESLGLPNRGGVSFRKTSKRFRLENFDVSFFSLSYMQQWWEWETLTEVGGRWSRIKRRRRQKNKMKKKRHEKAKEERRGRRVREEEEEEDEEAEGGGRGEEEEEEKTRRRDQKKKPEEEREAAEGRARHQDGPPTIANSSLWRAQNLKKLSAEGGFILISFDLKSLCISHNQRILLGGWICGVGSENSGRPVFAPKFPPNPSK